MNYRFSPEARVDLLAAADFYETQQSGLGAEFGVDVGLALARVLEAPGRWPEIEPRVRRFRLDQFPYALIYRIPGQLADVSPSGLAVVIGLDRLCHAHAQVAEFQA